MPSRNRRHACGYQGSNRRPHARKPRAASSLLVVGTGRGFEEKFSTIEFFWPLKTACRLLHVGVLGRCNRLGRLTAKNGANTDRIPQTTSKLCLRLAGPKGAGSSQTECVGDRGQKGGEAGAKHGSRRRTLGSTRPEGIARYFRPKPSETALAPLNRFANGRTCPETRKRYTARLCKSRRTGDGRRTQDGGRAPRARPRRRRSRRLNSFTRTYPNKGTVESCNHAGCR